MSGDPILPQELVADVLSRLPVKSLCRFKCVSHSWLALISDLHFAQTHLTRNNKKKNSDRRLILMFNSDSDSFFFGLCAVDYSSEVPISTKLHFISDEEDEFCDGWVGVVGSCNGLLLAINKRNRAHYLLNPSTRESIKLPKSPFELNSRCADNPCGFGYDSSTLDYKVVMLSYYENEDDDEESEGTTTDAIVSVYSLKANSWRRIQGSSYVNNVGNSSGVYVNGVLHWLAGSSRGSDVLSVIVAFDLANENFHEVKPPALVEFEMLLFCDLAVVGGCLCFLAQRTCTETDLWMMKEYRVRESWTKFTICRHDNFFGMKLLCLLEDGEFMLAIGKKDAIVFDDDEYILITDKLVAYDTKEGTTRDMVVCGIPTMFTACGTYVESIVSPYSSDGIVRRCEAQGKRMNRILQVMVEAYEAGTEQSSMNKESYRLKPSSSSRNIEAEASTSSSTNDHVSLSRCLDILKSIQIVEGPVYEKAMRMFEDPGCRNLFIKNCEEKRH